MANLLVHESSPYLLQHAYNPVNWRAWNDETLALAKLQNKLMLVSIGYSACHWCHVMEKQCFENEEAARIMNKYFICVKVDREERPDVDAIYMQALQLMSGQGGWPLNCFTLPDGRPVYGGTYFPLEKWMAVLENLQNLFETNLPAMESYALKLHDGIKQSQIYEAPVNFEVDFDGILLQAVEKWKRHFDVIDGGTQRVPKFPMPCNYWFLLHYGLIHKNELILNHVYVTLDKMSMGGLFDQLGGGFARYSTDGIWKVPHFEKMLYDNGQLISLYCKAFQVTKNNNYHFVVEKTLEFIRQTLTGKSGEFYSALDADSDGEEGKYYVWQKEELKFLLGNHFEHFSAYYNINETGYWEHNNFILMRVHDDASFCNTHQLTRELLHELKKQWEDILLPYRQKRIAPALDDKTICSWNMLMMKGYIDAYLVFNKRDYLDQALKNACFIVKNQIYDGRYLYHSYKEGKSSINGFLEDYALTADSFLNLYKATGDELWLIQAKTLCDTAIENFYDQNDGLFYLNSIKDSPLIARQKEVQDNVIPSSNAVMANVLFQIGIYFENDNYSMISKRMASHFYDEVTNYASAYACWAFLLMRFKQAIVQIAIPKKDYEKTILALQNINQINLFPYMVHHEASLAFIQDKKHKEYFYCCVNNVCSLPLNNQYELISAIEKI